MQRTDLYLIALAICCASCAVTKPVETAKTMDIYGPGVVQHTVIADMVVQSAKVTGTANGKARDTDGVKNEAVINAVKTANADLLVEPVFVVQRVRSRVQVSVSGFPASYTHFRPATQADVPLLESGLLQKARTAETAPLPAKRKPSVGAIAGVLGVLGFTVLVLSGAIF